MNRLRLLPFLLLLSVACNSGKNKAPSIPVHQKGSFGYDLDFLKKVHKDLIVLGNDTAGPRVIVIPAYQGRVMTSTATGDSGPGFGWINHDLISSQRPEQHMNAFGGEERFWLGPEGGQFSFYFAKGKEFVFDNWFVPKEIDTEPFDIVEQNADRARFRKDMQLLNYSGVPFSIRVERTVRLLQQQDIEQLLGMAVPSDVKTVAFETDNSITNRGAMAWTKKTGMPSIWILSMLNASPQTSVIVPFRKGDSATLGKVVTDDYFGKVPADRLGIKDSFMVFKADAKHRSKIGLSPQRAKPWIGSYDAEQQMLTLARFSLPANARDYVNSLWKIQEDPFSGDAVNAYNDGPVNGRQMGNFYEIESSSPAAALGPGMTLGHKHLTLHLQGNKSFLDSLSRKYLGAGLDQLF